MYTPLHTSIPATFSTSKTVDTRTCTSSDLSDLTLFLHRSGANGRLHSRRNQFLYGAGEHQSNALLYTGAYESAPAAGNGFASTSHWKRHTVGSHFSDSMLNAGEGRQSFIGDNRFSSGGVSLSAGSEYSSLSESVFSLDTRLSSDGAGSPTSSGGHQLSVIGADRGTQAWVSGPLARGPT